MQQLGLEDFYVPDADVVDDSTLLKEEEANPADQDYIEAEEEFKDSELIEGEMGTTEYCLIGLWAVFTAGIFGLLYRITQEADEEQRKN